MLQINIIKQAYNSVIYTVTEFLKGIFQQTKHLQHTIKL